MAKEKDSPEEREARLRIAELPLILYQKGELVKFADDPQGKQTYRVGETGLTPDEQDGSLHRKYQVQLYQWGQQVTEPALWLRYISDVVFWVKEQDLYPVSGFAAARRRADDAGISAGKDFSRYLLGLITWAEYLDRERALEAEFEGEQKRAREEGRG